MRCNSSMAENILYLYSINKQISLSSFVRGETPMAAYTKVFQLDLHGKSVDGAHDGFNTSFQRNLCRTYPVRGAKMAPHLVIERGSRLFLHALADLRGSIDHRTECFREELHVATSQPLAEGTRHHAYDACNYLGKLDFE